MLGKIVNTSDNFNGDTPQTEEEPIKKGKFGLHGTGLLGCVVGNPAIFFVQINKLCSKSTLKSDDLIVTIKPTISKNQSFGIKPPTSIDSTIELVENKNSPNITYKVKYTTTYAGSYDIEIEYPHAEIFQKISNVIVDPGTNLLIINHQK